MVPESRNMSSKCLFFTLVKGSFCEMLGAWAGTLRTGIQSSRTLGFQGLMGSRIQGQPVSENIRFKGLQAKGI